MFINFILYLILRTLLRNWYLVSYKANNYLSLITIYLCIESLLFIYSNLNDLLLDKYINYTNSAVKGINIIHIEI